MRAVVKQGSHSGQPCSEILGGAYDGVQPIHDDQCLELSGRLSEGVVYMTAALICSAGALPDDGVF